MNARQQLEEGGWSVQFMKNKVCVEHPTHGSFRVCDKRFGEWGYECELDEALQWIRTHIHTWKENPTKRESTISNVLNNVVMYEGDKTMSNPFIQYLSEKHEADNAKVTEDEQGFIDSLDEDLIASIMENDKSIEKFTNAREKGRYLRCKNMLELRTDKIAEVFSAIDNV